MTRTALLVTTSRWLSSARLAMALAKAGFIMDVACPPGHPVASTHCARRLFPYRGLMPTRSIGSAIAEAKPDLIIPCDELAVRHLHDLHRQNQHQKNGAMCQLIERSLGARESFYDFESRTRLMEVAEAESIRVPKTCVIGSAEVLKRWADANGFPAVLKSDGSSGGTGVRLVRTLGEAEDAFCELQAPPSLIECARQLWIENSSTLVLPWLRRRKSIVNAQAYIPGLEATSTVACWKGRVLASLHFEVLKTAYPGGPSTVVRLLENAEMSSAVEKMAKRLHLSGIHGFDFILDSASGDAWLIEMNPRATQVGHLTLGPERDLPGALYAAVSHQPIQAGRKVTENPTIAFFPQEWIRDPESEFLRSAHQDVPWEEPELIRASCRTLPKHKHAAREQRPVEEYLKGHADLVKQRSFQV